MRAARQLSTHAAAAKAIRTELKIAFPTTMFTVRSSSFSGGDDVSISWSDGPRVKQVDEIVRTYQYGHFDGMIDLYEYSNRRPDLPQVKYVLTQRRWSPETLRALVNWLNRRDGYALTINEETGWIADDPPHPSGSGWQSQDLHRLFGDASLVCAACHAVAQVGDRYCAACGAALTESTPLARAA